MQKFSIYAKFDATRIELALVFFHYFNQMSFDVIINLFIHFNVEHKKVVNFILDRTNIRVQRHFFIFNRNLKIQRRNVQSNFINIVFLLIKQI